MATNMLAYKGIKKKDDLVRTLRERGYRDDLADTIVKWKNKDLVQALMKSDLERDGASMKDAGAPDDKGSDDEACEDALERDGDNMLWNDRIRFFEFGTTGSDLISI